MTLRPIQEAGGSAISRSGNGCLARLALLGLERYLNGVVFGRLRRLRDGLSLSAIAGGVFHIWRNADGTVVHGDKGRRQKTSRLVSMELFDRAGGGIFRRFKADGSLVAG